MPAGYPFDYARSAALVTGASRGIGASIARSLASRGCPDIVLTARSEDDLRELAAELAARFGVRTHVLAADLADADAPAHLKAETDRLGLVIDLLVNNAGFGDWGPYAERPVERAENMIAVNCTSLVALTRLYLPAMLARGRGGIVNVASTAAFQPIPYMSVYGATKAFVLSFSEALWVEMRDKTDADIRVVCLCPGNTATDFDFGDYGSRRGRFEGTPASTPEEVAVAALRALDGNASYAVVGLRNYVGTLGARVAPRAVIARVAGALFRPTAEGEKPDSGKAARRMAVAGLAVTASVAAVGVVVTRRRKTRA